MYYECRFLLCNEIKITPDRLYSPMPDNHQHPKSSSLNSTHSCPATGLPLLAAHPTLNTTPKIKNCALLPSVPYVHLHLFPNSKMKHHIHQLRPATMATWFSETVWLGYLVVPGGHKHRIKEGEDRMRESKREADSGAPVVWECQ